jgi:peptidoglycan/xylan/chitin deacetylase (PgdA/CDA1 family)
MVEATGDRRQLLDMSEIDEMRRSGLFRFGSHGRRHLRLIESLPSAMLQEEIVQSRASLCEMLGQSVDLFCYPNGDYCPDALELVRSVYKAAVTTCSGWNYEDLDPHLLRRQSLHDDISSDELCFLAAVGGVL